jgi:hypothetical protein
VAVVKNGYTAIKNFKDEKVIEIEKIQKNNRNIYPLPIQRNRCVLSCQIGLPS